MAHILHLKQTYEQTRSGVIAMLRAAVRAIGGEHTLALRAAEKVASRHRRNAAEVRAMYVSAREPQPENDVVEKMKVDR